MVEKVTAVTQNLSLTIIRDYTKINFEFLKRLSGPTGPYQGLLMGEKATAISLKI